MRWRDNKEPVTVRREAKIMNDQGLHARPAAQFVKQAKSFRSEIWLIKDDKRYSAASLIDILRANVDHGATVILEATGTDAEEAIERLVQVVNAFRE